MTIKLGELKNLTLNPRAESLRRMSCNDCGNHS